MDRARTCCKSDYCYYISAILDMNNNTGQIIITDIRELKPEKISRSFIVQLHNVVIKCNPNLMCHK